MSAFGPSVRNCDELSRFSSPQAGYLRSLVRGIGKTRLALAAAAAHGQSEAESTYSEVFYSSGNLRIQAYLYKPDGDGPFPVVIYNHGSRDGRERASVPFQYVGKMLTRAGYVALVPERRGYGKSDGSVWRQEVGKDPSRLIPRLQAETDDVLAATDYLRTVRFADARLIGIKIGRAHV